MNPVIEPWVAYLILALYAGLMIAAVGLFASRVGPESKDHFLLADRRLSVFRGAASVAVSWIWAPAVFFCALKAYTQGLPGVFWFTVPNVLCFISFALVARTMRKQNQLAYSMPDYIRGRFAGNGSAHLAAVSACLGIDIVALLFNTFIGAFLLSVLAGIPIWVGIVGMMLVALSYSVWRGLPASVVTDVVQLISILAIASIITPWATAKAGGFSAVRDGLAGSTGEFGSLANFEVFFSFGILATLNLLSVPLVDQMFYQRAFACPPKDLMKTFIFGGALFAIVPIVLSVLGLIAVQPAVRAIVEQPNFPKILANVAAVQHYLPTWTLFGFVVVAICALSSTLDSALCAIGALWGHDVYGRYINRQASEAEVLQVSRRAVVSSGVGVVLVSILFQEYLNGDIFFNFNGVLASAVVPPLLLSIFWKRTTALGVAVGIILAVIAGEPLMLWSSYRVYVAGDPAATSKMVIAAISTPILSALVCVGISLRLSARRTTVESRTLKE